MADNPGDPVAALRAEAERARRVTHDVATWHATMRTMLATELLRDVIPAAAALVAVFDPGSNPSVDRVLLADGTVVDENVWIDDNSLIEEQLGCVLDYCDPETAGWEQDGSVYRLTLLPPPRGAERSE